MRRFRPTSLQELVEVRAQRPEWLLVAGGTDVMVPINFGQLRPSGVIDISRIDEMRGCAVHDGVLRIGAGETFARLDSKLRDLAPGLAVAARTVGSPQIRNRATIGGNLATASPAGDALPVLLAADADIELRSIRGPRSVAARDFFLGPKRTAMEPDEFIEAVRLPVSTEGQQQFSKIGPRNAMVIAVASFAVSIDVRRRRVGTGMGSVGPTPLSAPAAERFLEQQLWPAGDPVARPASLKAVERFATLAAAAAQPIDDVRGTAAYRRHVLATMARRTTTWALNQLELEVES